MYSIESVEVEKLFINKQVEDLGKMGQALTSCFKGG
jgi:hypothetical protein